MTKFERILNVTKGKEVDHTPSGFWFHFPDECFFGDKSVEAHLNLYNEIDTDLFKIMNEVKYENNMRPDRTADWKNWSTVKVKGSRYEDSLDVVKKISDKIGDEVPLLFTIHGVFVSTQHGTKDFFKDNYADMNNFLSRDFRANPEVFRDVFKIVGETLLELSLAALDAGAHGIYYAALGGEMRRFDEGLYEEYVRPVEMEILSEISKKTEYLTLHICKDKVRIPMFKDYPCNIVNWAIHENDFSLEEGWDLFQKPILGGFDDRSGIMTESDQEAISRATEDMIQRMKGKPFILGSDCTLPTEVPLGNIKQVVATSKAYR
ncbi:MAG: uroporphyrinogen decarboxylase family protein [Spirochaetales bacterium]|nr:uroporphyrinogen decarboxylase family protein [Spirochaetales bacterium]